MGALSAAALLTGCGSGAPPAIDRTDLVNDLAARLSHAGEVSYSARYQVAGGSSATVAQTAAPARTAYRWDSGALVLTTGATTSCGGKPVTCSTTAPPGPGQPVGADLPKHGLVTAQQVSALLTAAVLDLRTDIQQRDSTIAGQPAACVDVNGVKDGAGYEFDVCVITDGVLGSFAGTVNGKAIEMTMTHYSRVVAEDSFATAMPSPTGD
ncbi:hypothetical protein [Hamadaea tsunoensis]|uniref:hypothetical protein n=1 Tax=Hamadaea tsunoensis TaxID=53368 RepID=UPI0012F8DC9B|nr:hypothetical protein [Hamadaea tsunoensis]